VKDKTNPGSLAEKTMSTSPWIGTLEWRKDILK
jgi:hypothetical protein